MATFPSTAHFPKRPFVDPDVRARRNAETARRTVKEQYILARKYAEEGRSDLALKVFKRVERGRLLTPRGDLPPAIQRVDSHFRSKYAEAFERAARYWGDS